MKIKFSLKSEKKPKKANEKLQEAPKSIWRDWRKATAIAIAIGLFILYFNLLLFGEVPQLFGALNLFAAIIALGVPLFVRYREHAFAKSLEEHFPNFMRDITNNINVGMSLPKAIKTAQDNDYGKMTPYVKALAAKIDWGIPFEQVLDEFGRESKSSVIKRAVKGIIEAHRSGGTIGTVLHAMTVSVKELEKIKKERATSVYSQMVTGYFIYFLFLGIMLSLSKFLIPVLTFQAGAVAAQDIGRLYSEMFRSLVVIQGLFAGLGIGKMAEGTVVAGFKHSFVLVVVGYTSFVVF
jgi:flagellar protein FlaJ